MSKSNEPGERPPSQLALPPPGSSTVPTINSSEGSGACFLLALSALEGSGAEGTEPESSRIPHPDPSGAHRFRPQSRVASRLPLPFSNRGYPELAIQLTAWKQRAKTLSNRGKMWGAQTVSRSTQNRFADGLSAGQAFGRSPQGQAVRSALPPQILADFARGVVARGAREAVAGMRTRASTSCSASASMFVSRSSFPALWYVQPACKVQRRADGRTASIHAWLTSLT